MSTPPGMTGNPGLDPQAAAPAPRQYRRHALGLPAGSIRALLALMVLGVLWLLALYAPTEQGEVPLDFIYLQYVMILILAHFFAAHGNTIGKNVSEHSPLGLPGGSVRFLLLAGYIGLIVWLVMNKRTFERAAEGTLFLPLVLVSGFFVGFVVTKLVLFTSPSGQLPFWFQDVQAWFALLAVFGLAIITMIHLFILPNIQESLRFGTTTIEIIVAAVVGFYFGARS
jgi:hypothetical protein